MARSLNSNSTTRSRRFNIPSKPISRFFIVEKKMVHDKSSKISCSTFRLCSKPSRLKKFSQLSASIIERFFFKTFHESFRFAFCRRCLPDPSNPIVIFSQDILWNWNEHGKSLAIQPGIDGVAESRVERSCDVEQEPVPAFDVVDARDFQGIFRFGTSDSFVKCRRVDI